jgi:hypothetical protein
MFTAIVLNPESHTLCILHALELGLLPNGHSVKCHHVTLNMGAARDVSKLGSGRKLTVTHYGQIRGRVCAFRVQGAADSENKVPHVTVATFGNAKPRESNDIPLWVALEKPFEIFGTVCEVK